MFSTIHSIGGILQAKGYRFHMVNTMHTAWVMIEVKV